MRSKSLLKCNFDGLYFPCNDRKISHKKASGCDMQVNMLDIPLLMLWKNPNWKGKLFREKARPE
jgi:hypothetical protein